MWSVWHLQRVESQRSSDLGDIESYLIVQRFFHRVQWIQRIDGVVEVRKWVVNATAASIHIEVAIHARRVFNGVSVWIELLVSLVAVTAASENSK